MVGNYYKHNYEPEEEDFLHELEQENQEIEHTILRKVNLFLTA